MRPPLPPLRRAGTVLAGTAARVAQSVATPLLPSDYLDLVAPLRAGADLRGRVLDVVPETRDAATLRLQVGRGWAGHVPGQYVRVGVDVDGVRHWRPYSLTSAVRGQDRVISITVKAPADGFVSTHLVRATAPGTLLHLDQATGDFTLGGHRGPALFVTAGSGVTPVMGLLRNHLHHLDDVVVLHSAPTPQDAIFGAELRRLHAQGRLRLVERHTRREGQVTPEALDGLVPDWRQRRTWACGPAPMLDALEAHWSQEGLAARLHTERFTLATAATGEGGAVTFTRSGVVVEADGGTPLLDAGEDAGVLMPSGCRMGICFRCVLPLREGAVRDLRSGEITTAVPEDAVRIQTCVSAAAGPCAIDV